MPACRDPRAFERPPFVTITVDGQPVDAVPGESLVAALMVAGRGAIGRSPRGGLPRGPFCMMGICQDCLVEVGGVRCQACLVPVQAGLDVRTVWASDG